MDEQNQKLDLAGSAIDLGQNADWISIWAGVDLQGYFYTHSRNIHRIKLNHTISFDTSLLSYFLILFYF